MGPWRRAARAVGALLASAALAAPAWAEGAATLRLGSTTSVRDSGLLDALLPVFQAKSGIEVQAIAVGTGQALALAARGDVDLVLVHDRDAEKAFVAAGHGAERRELFYNELLLVGPRDDPAGVRGVEDPAEALRRVAAARAPFASRGDDSGTHRAELRLWERAGVDPRGAPGDWYRELGAGMGATLNTAAQLPAYALVDEATWDTFRNKGALVALVRGAAELRNVYSVILLNPARRPGLKHAEARALADWLASAEGRQAVAGYRPRGKPLFHPLPAPPARP